MPHRYVDRPPHQLTPELIDGFPRDDHAHRWTGAVSASRDGDSAVWRAPPLKSSSGPPRRPS